jgi:hypothetical protein
LAQTNDPIKIRRRIPVFTGVDSSEGILGRPSGRQVRYASFFGFGD